MNKTLVEAIYDRYNDMSESYSSCSPSDSSLSSSSDNVNSIISFYIPAYSPRKTQSGLVITSCSLVMSDQYIKAIGDYDALKRSCKNVVELDLAKNQIESWDEVKHLLNALNNLRLLNLSHNPLNFVNQNYYFTDWPNINQLKILILNSCYLPLNKLQYLLDKLDNLNELHLSSNNYDEICFDNNFIKPSLTILYLNNNRLYNWSHVCKLSNCFPNLETLVISDNNIKNFNHELCRHDEDYEGGGEEEEVDHIKEKFLNLQQLIINKLPIDDWSCIDQLRCFPQLKHVRIQNIPLLDAYTDEEKYFLLVAHLEGPKTLNGSEINAVEKENCERTMIRYYMDRINKPKRYYELEEKHGKLNKLADVNLEANKHVYVKIKFDQKFVYEYIDVRMTVGDFKKKLEKFVGHSSNKFRLFYIDIEAFGLLGPEEMRHANRCLHSFNIRDGDEFEIDLKQPLEQTTTTTTSNTTTTSTNRKTSASTTATTNKPKSIRPVSSCCSIKKPTKPTSISKTHSQSDVGKMREIEQEPAQILHSNEQNADTLTPSPTPPSTPIDSNNDATVPST